MTFIKYAGKCNNNIIDKSCPLNDKKSMQSTLRTRKHIKLHILPQKGSLNNI